MTSERTLKWESLSWNSETRPSIFESYVHFQSSVVASMDMATSIVSKWRKSHMYTSKCEKFRVHVWVLMKKVHRFSSKWFRLLSKSNIQRCGSGEETVTSISGFFLYAILLPLLLPHFNEYLNIRAWSYFLRQKDSSDLA